MKKLSQPRDLTTVLLEKETLKNLRHMARKDQTYDQLINELMRLKEIRD